MRQEYKDEAAVLVERMARATTLKMCAQLKTMLDALVYAVAQDLARGTAEFPNIEEADDMPRVRR